MSPRSRRQHEKAAPGRNAGKPGARRDSRAVADYWRALGAAERGTPRVVPPADAEIALVYPNTYAVGMSSLGFQMVYRWINAHPAALAERFFCEGRPARSIENQRPLEAFDFVAFGIAYELDYLEAVRFLLDHGICPIAAERDPMAEPLILAGGICLAVNRLPIYDLADLLVLGDGEGPLPRLLDAWAAAGRNRARFLEAAAGIEGVEVTEGARRRFRLAPVPVDPLRPEPVAPHVAMPFDTADACSVIVTPGAELADRFLVEIARGCPYRCRFCFIGHAACHRVRPFEAIREMIDRGRPLTWRFGLVAGAVGRHPDIDRLCAWCLGEGLDVSFSSLRVEDVTPAMLDLLAASGQQSVTIAPEAGSERLRRRLGKGLTDAQVIDFAAAAVWRGLTDLRLYFMVGLPGEEPDDVEAIARLAEAVRKAAVAARPEGRGRVSLAVNASIFIPKPGTPFARVETPSAGEIGRRLKRLAAAIGRLDGVAFRMPSQSLAAIQRYLSWADRRALAVLIEAARSGAAWREVLTREAKSLGT